MPLPRPEPGSNSKVPEVAAAPATPPSPSVPLEAGVDAAIAAPSLAISVEPNELAPVQLALAGPPAAPLTEAEPPVVTIIPPGSTADLPVPMPPSRPGNDGAAPVGATPSGAPSPDPNTPEADQAAAAPLDHEQLVRQFDASAVDLGEDLAELALPPQRPAGAAEAAGAAAPTPGQNQTDDLTGLTSPPPRPASVEAAAKPAEAPLPAEAGVTASSRFNALATGPPAPSSGTSETALPDPDAPTELAAMSAPRPPTRPARPLVPVKLPPASLLPALGGATSSKVRNAATDQGLPLDQTALIGVLNLDGGRKALLRMPDGRYKSVVVGDEVDGWRVSAIGVDAMKFSKSGQDRTLQLVNR